MLFAPESQETLERRDKLLSSHLETWEKEQQDVKGQGGWSQLSMGSSEMGKLASPFDDIGFLAGGRGPAMDPVKEDGKNGETEQAKPTLGKFLATSKSEGFKPVQEHQQQRPTLSRPQLSRPTLSRRGSARLDKTISKRDQFEGDEVSLALSAAVGGLERCNASRNLFDPSKNSFGLSVLDAPKGTTKTLESSKSSLGASKSSASKNRSRGHDSKSSFGLLGASRSSDASIGARTIGSKFSSMMRSKSSETDKLSKSEEKITALESENRELGKENKLLQAKLKVMEQSIERQNAMKEWRSIEELASSSVELWQYKSLLILADLELDRMVEQLAAHERLVEAKERSICNLETVRHKQEKRIGYLEVQCLQNGIDIDEDFDITPVKRVERAPLNDEESTCDNDNSFASFGDEVPLPFNVDYSPAPDKLVRSTRSEDSKAKDKEKDEMGRSARSESSRSMGMSSLSAHSDTSENDEPNDEPPMKPDSWLALDMALGQEEAPSSPSIKIKMPNSKTGSNDQAHLEKYLAASAHESNKEHCIETCTWDPTKMIDFASKSPRDVGVIPPPPPPPDNIRSDPAPASRKKADGVVVSRSSRSKSPGTRRRLKGSKGEGDATTSKLEAPRRSKSPGTRRKLKDPSAAPSSSALGPSASSLPSRRKLKANNPLSNSTHSLGRGSAHRRRQRKENGFDRQTVSTALEKALGNSLNVLDMDDDFLHMIAPDGAVSKFDSSFLVRSKASKAKTIDFEEGLDLDAVFRD